jgi:hypothetical protein
MEVIFRLRPIPELEPYVKKLKKNCNMDYLYFQAKKKKIFWKLTILLLCPETNDMFKNSL